MDLISNSGIIIGAAGYSFVYLLGGGGIVGAAVIYVIARLAGQ